MTASNRRDPSSSTSSQPFSDGLPVRLIATPRERLATCRFDERLPEVVARNREDKFDYFPIVSPKSNANHIIGLLDLHTYHEGEPPDDVVEKHAAPITEDMLIGENASIISFIETADQRPCRLVVAGPQISGIVSIYDMQKLPARAALFAIVTQIEMKMADVIRMRCPATEAWIKFLTPARGKKVAATIKETKKEDAFVDELLFTQFCDKRDIINEMKALSSAPAFTSDMKAIEMLRNNLAHANEYAASKAQAVKVCETVRNIRKWLETLSDPIVSRQEFVKEF